MDKPVRSAEKFIGLHDLHDTFCNFAAWFNGHRVAPYWFH